MVRDCEVVGHDGLNKIYAFRKIYNGALTPGKAVHKAYISYAGKEIEVSSGQLLRKGNYEWVYGKNGSVPPNAVIMGHNDNGSPLYIRRAMVNDALTPGKIDPPAGYLYIPYGGKEHYITVYTVLCYKDVHCPVCPKLQIPKSEWVDFQLAVSERPECEIVGQDGSMKIYAFRKTYEGAVTPGKAVHRAFISYAGKEIEVTTGQLLRKGNYEWLYGKNGSVPPNAVIMGSMADGSPLYMGRAVINGTLTPGKIYPPHGVLYIPYDGVEHRIDTYTVLCYKDVYCPSPSCPKPTSSPKSSIPKPCDELS
ncbi:uncharacterized protein LOC126574378 [Anopheles aquasalis]|uniref:uncharacterized protein LOC126574378 n=1 Tax=Anopheles aquasalis TaxID=42839 RepID=UPI00215B689F|nr:uncharacterized protein LOC126574378 [Anopheles aquasalis]